MLPPCGAFFLSPSYPERPTGVEPERQSRGQVVRVVLADDHPIVLTGLRAVLQTEPGVEIVAAAPDGATALATIRAHEPDVAVLDIDMPQFTGLDVLDAMKADGLSTRVVFLTGSASDQQIATAVEQGAWGLLLKEHALDTLVACL